MPKLTNTNPAAVVGPLPSRLDPELAQILRNISDKMETDAPTAAKEIREHVVSHAAPPDTPQKSPYCPMPSDLCRVSPFFPLNRKGMKDRAFLTDMVITNSSWGSITYTGPKLTTYEEDVMMAVLTILNLKNTRLEAEVDGKRTYMYRGSVLALLKLMSYREFGKTIYKRVLNALSLLTVAGVRLTVKKQDRSKEWIMSSILAAVKYDDKGKELTVVVNPYFYEIFASGSYTLLDLRQRMAIDSPVAKCLHRFVMSHRSNEWRGHFLTLAAALNIDLEQPKYQIRRLLTKAIRNLIELRILSPASKLVSRDVVLLFREQHTKLPRKVTA